MARRRVIVWCGVFLAAATLCYFYPLFRIRPLEDNIRERRSGRNAPAGTTGAVNVSDYAKHFWREQLPAAFDEAVDIEDLLTRFDANAQQARATYGRHVGLGGDCFFFVRGVGKVESTGSDHCILAVGVLPRHVWLHTGVVVGNAVRDATGLIDVNQFANSQDFNNLSNELNRRVETGVIDSSREQLRAGTWIAFVGCAQVGNEQDINHLRIIPVHLAPLPPGAQP